MASDTTSVMATAVRPLFGGYLLVAAVVTWLAGIALRAAGPLAAAEPSVWGFLAGIALALALVAWLVLRRAAAWATQAKVRYGLALAFLLGCLFLGAWRAAATDPTREGAALATLAATGTDAEVRVQGDVVAEPDVRDGYRYIIVDVTSYSTDQARTWRHASGRIEAAVLGADDWYMPAYGDTVSLVGTLGLPSASGTPAGVVAVLHSARATVEARGGGNPVFAWLFAARVKLAQAIQRALPEPEAALLIGILLGLKTPMLRSRLSLFTDTGTIHLVVPAGLKVSVLATLAGSALRPAGRWMRVGGSLVAVAAYAALGGGGPAAIRAAIMGALLAVAPIFARPYSVYTGLALAALAMTAFEPLLIYDAGFQLTMLATLGLPLLVPTLHRWLLAALGPLARVSALAVAAELVAVTLAAQIATLPVLALTFHQISFVAPLANLLTVPLLAPLLLLGAALAGVGLLGVVPLSLPLAWLTWPLLWYVDGVIQLCAALPGAWLAVGEVPGVLAWAYYALLASVRWGVPRVWRRPLPAPATSARASTPAGKARVIPGRAMLAGLLVVCLLVGCGATAPALAAGRTGSLAFLDVGPGGAAIFLRLPSGMTVLIDGGPSGPALESALAGRLPFWQRTLDLALLTDPRPGAARGLEDAAQHYTIGRAADAGMLHPTLEYTAWRDAADGADANYAQVRQGDTITLDATSTMRVLAPQQQLYDGGDTTTASNDAILRLDTPGLRVLFLGAADSYALAALSGAGEDLRAEVVALALVPGQPLDLNGPLGAILRLAHPRLVVIGDAPVTPDSAAAQRAIATPGAPDDAAATALNALVYRTSLSGTIELQGDASGWNLLG